MSTPFFFPNQLPLAPDFKNPASSANQSRFLAGGFFNLCRHPVGFRTVVSLFAIFDLNGHGGTIVPIPKVTNQKLISSGDLIFFDISLKRPQFLPSCHC